jgi:hypothetical protein
MIGIQAIVKDGVLQEVWLVNGDKRIMKLDKTAYIDTKMSKNE